MDSFVSELKMKIGMKYLGLGGSSQNLALPSSMFRVLSSAALLVF